MIAEQIWKLDIISVREESVLKLSFITGNFPVEFVMYSGINLHGEILQELSDQLQLIQ